MKGSRLTSKSLLKVEWKNLDKKMKKKIRNAEKIYITNEETSFMSECEWEERESNNLKLILRFH